MKLKMAKNSLFAILLRSPWWISIGIAAALALIAMALVPARFAPYAASGGMPFLIVGLIAAYRQLRAPSAARVQQTLDTVGAMQWRAFADAIEKGFQNVGYEVTRLPQGAADFKISRGTERALVSCKRWKAASHGVEALRELHAASEAQAVPESFYILVGQLSGNASRFAAEKKIRLIQGEALAQLLSPVLPK